MHDARGLSLDCSATTSHHLIVIVSLSSTPPLIGYISSIPDMSHSPSASFLLIFDTALKDYRNQTGMDLVDHPFPKQLEECNCVDSISSLLQEHAQRFRDFQGEKGKIMKSLECAVHVVHAPQAPFLVKVLV